MLAALNAVGQGLILFAVFRKSCSDFEHRSDPVCNFANIIAEAGDISIDRCLLVRDTLLGLALHTHQCRERLRVLNEDAVVC